MKNNQSKLLMPLAILACFAVQPGFAADLFNDDMFDSKTNNQFGDFDTPDASSSQSEQKPDPEAAKKAYKQMVDRADEQMRQQMMKVASWLQEFSMRNQNRFPGVYGSSGTTARAAAVQLTELVGKQSPYSSISSDSINARELIGLQPGLSFRGSGSPIASDEYTAELSSDAGGRIQLGVDGSANSNATDSYRNEPPGSWQAAPGTICANGTGSGYYYVWGAGVDGKPVKDINGQTYIIATDVSAKMDEQGQEYGN